METIFIYRSSFELKVFSRLDRSERVAEWIYEPFSIEYKDEIGVKRNYIPDIWIRLENGDECILEVKADWQLEVDEVLYKIEQGRVFCELSGLRFIIIGNDDLEYSSFIDKIKS